jgi:hypothetical protein
METTEDRLDKVADQVVEAARSFVARSLARHLESQRDLIARADKQAERIAVLEHRLAVLEGKTPKE